MRLNDVGGFSTRNFKLLVTYMTDCFFRMSNEPATQMCDRFANLKVAYDKVIHVMQKNALELSDEDKQELASLINDKMLFSFYFTENVADYAYLTSKSYASDILRENTNEYEYLTGLAFFKLYETTPRNATDTGYLEKAIDRLKTYIAKNELNERMYLNRVLNAKYFHTRALYERHNATDLPIMHANLLYIMEKEKEKKEKKKSDEKENEAFLIEYTAFTVDFYLVATHFYSKEFAKALQILQSKEFFREAPPTSDLDMNQVRALLIFFVHKNRINTKQRCFPNWSPLWMKIFKLVSRMA